jgi:4-amino-4-deoxy-L-arabinose transferase-like glycosyltransferase
MDLSTAGKAASQSPERSHWIGRTRLFFGVLAASLTLAASFFLGYPRVLSFFLKFSPDGEFSPLTHAVLRNLSWLVAGLGLSLLVICIFGGALGRFWRGLEDRLEALGEVQYLTLLLCLALALRVAWVLCVSTEPVADFAYYDEKAWGIAQGEGYHDKGKPTAVHPPGYLFFLAFIYWIFGKSWLAGQMANAVLNTLLCLVTYRFARLGFSLKTSRLAALCVALWPNQIFYCNLLGTEVLFSFLFFWALWVWMKSSDERPLRTDILAGLLLGLATLVRPASMLLPGMLLFYMKLYGSSWRLCFLRSFRVGVVILLTLLPWSVRNLVVMKAPLLISSNDGINLWVAFNEEATGGYKLPQNNPVQPIKDELEKNRVAGEIAKKFLREHPGRAVALIPAKFFYMYATDFSGAQFSFAETERPVPMGFQLTMMAVAQLYYMVMIAWVLVSTVRAWWDPNRIPVRGFMILLVAYFTFFYAGIFHGEDRFHHVLIPAFAMLALGRCREVPPAAT